MRHALHRMQRRRVGVFGLVLLILLVLVVAHTLIMGVGHDAEAACGPCVVVIATGLAGVVALGVVQGATSPGLAVFSTVFVSRTRRRRGRPPTARFAVLRL